MTQDIRESVREKYARAITNKLSCCGISTYNNPVTGNLYEINEIADLPEDIVKASFGCGNPTALAELYAGEDVLDLGSGAGLDVILSAKRIGPYGKAYGLDMTDEMLTVAKNNQARSGISNVEFLKGHIEAIPLSDNTIDVIISNCVINLSVDKDRVLKEAYRVLKPGGRFAISDIVLTRELPQSVQENVTAWAGCIAGAMLEMDYQEKLISAGFTNIEIVRTRTYDLTGSQSSFFAGLSEDERLDLNGALVSAFIRAKKPANLLIEGSEYSIRNAVEVDLPAIEKLLTESGLPTFGVFENLSTFFVADYGGVIGVIGIEVIGNKGMLRSMAVSAKSRKCGVATALVEHSLEAACQIGVKEIYLLTNTAEKFALRWGFYKIERSKIPYDLTLSSSFHNCCSSSSICMKKNL